MEKFNLAPSVRAKIEEAYGKAVRYPADCEHLAANIAEITRESVGVTTLKRIFGFVNDVRSPRLATLDILARYAGYSDYDSMRVILLGEGDSGFEGNEDIRLSALQQGNIVRFEYLPDRMVRVRYLGDGKFEVEESVGSSLRRGDLLLIRGFAYGQPLTVDSVLREGRNLGRYIAGKTSGLTALEKEE